MSEDESVLVYYDGGFGSPEVRPRLNSQTSAHFTAERSILPLPPKAASSLLSPAVGGGRYHRAIPLPEAAKRFGCSGKKIEKLGATGEVTVKAYLPRGSSPEETPSPTVCLVLDPASVKRLRQPDPEPEKKEEADSAVQTSAPAEAEPPRAAKPRTRRSGGAKKGGAA